MAAKKIQTGKKPKLAELIYELNIPQTTLAEMAGISPSSFKNKMSFSNDIYKFSDEEYLRVVEALTAMKNRINSFIKQHDNINSYKKYTSKK